MTSIMTFLGRKLITLLMVATVLGTGKEQSVNDWQKMAVVQNAEEEMGCSSVDIILYQKTTYTLNTGKKIRTNHVIGLVKDDELYRDKSWNVSDTQYNLTVYNTEGEVVAIVDEDDIHFLDIYRDGVICERICQEFSGNTCK